MITIQGKGISADVSIGPLYFYRRASAEVEHRTVADTRAEWQRSPTLPSSLPGCLPLWMIPIYCNIGADKQTGYFGLPHEDNPAMGMRALRVSLSRPELFRTHLQGKVREVNTYASSPHILNAIADSYTKP